jgi:Protein of unknown function (DUF2800)
MSANGSASGSERTIGCPASLALPRVRRTTDYAHRGRGIHAFIRAVKAGVPVERALELVDDEYRDTCRNLQWERLGADLHDVRCEVAYALDPVARTARFLGVDIGRDYERFALGPNEVPGSLDIEGLRIDDVPVIIDTKTGWLDVTDAEENGQGLFFGCVQYLLTGATEVEFRINKVLASGRVLLDSSHTYSALDMDLYMDEYAQALAQSREARRVYLAGGTPDVNVGAWCRYCESMEACPAYTRLAMAMATDTAVLEARIAAMPLADAGQAWLKAKQIESMLDRVLSALKARARQEPLPTADGKVVRPIAFEREDLVVSAALELLRERGASEAEIAALYRSHVVEQIRETVDPKAPKAMRKTRRSRAA